MEKLMTVEQTAEILNVRKIQVYSWIAEGILPSVRIGRKLRVCPKALQKFCEEGGRGYAGTWRKGG